MPEHAWFSIAGFELHATFWGDPQAKPLVMWHGFAQNGRDFDVAARALSARFRVVCPDLIGRGLSSWSRDPAANYRLDRYAFLAHGLADALELAQFSWLGTSMGGHFGMIAAAGSLRGRITRMVLNDVGPALPPAMRGRMRAQGDAPPAFASLTEAEDFLRKAWRGRGPTGAAEWRALAAHFVRRLPDGGFAPHHDPEIGAAFIHHPDDGERWPEYDAIRCPTPLLRGAQSRLLPPEMADEMTRRGPKPRLLAIPGCGHAPALNSDAQIAAVADFLAA